MADEKSSSPEGQRSSPRPLRHIIGVIVDEPLKRRVEALALIDKRSASSWCAIKLLGAVEADERRLGIDPNAEAPI